MVRKRLSADVLCQIGLDFFEFLKETDRASITERLELREIYNTEFRIRWGALHWLFDTLKYVRNNGGLVLLWLFQECWDERPELRIGPPCPKGVSQNNETKRHYPLQLHGIHTSHQSTRS